MIAIPEPRSFLSKPSEDTSFRAPVRAIGRVDATTMPAVRLPRDEEAHRAPIEWWHFMLHLTAPRPLTLVVSLLKGTPLDLDVLSGLCGVVITIDRRERTYRARAMLRPFALASHGADGGFRFDLRARTGRLTTTALRASGGNGSYQLAYEGAEGRFHLALHQDVPAVLLGTRGVMTYPGGVELGYYAFTNLDVTGELGGLPAAGKAWMEHQWGRAEVRDFRWKYLAIQLESGEQIVAFRVDRREPDSTPMTYGAHVLRSGEHRVLHDSVIDDVGAPWRDRYPLRSRLRAPSVQMELEVEPVMDEQRCAPALSVPVLPPFWEGASTVRGSFRDRPVRGLAITELSGCEAKGGDR